MLEPRRLFLVVLFDLVLATARPAPAQMVPVLNGSFVSDLAGWAQQPPDSASWSPPPDVDGCPGGAAWLGNGVDDLVSLHQCLPMSGVEPLTVVVRGGQAEFLGEGFAELVVWFFSDPACSSLIGVDNAGTTSTDWTELRLDFSALPAGANSIRIVLSAGTYDEADAAYGFFDEVRVARAALLFNDGFEADSMCRWSAESP